jgi:hypothetical protein
MNILYNSFLNLNFKECTQAVAFADDLILLTSGSTALEAENNVNIDLRKITDWASRKNI